jgi:chromosome segregation ATPase
MKNFLPLLFLVPALLHAADQDPQVAINTKLREGLRNSMLALQAAQTDLATAQAAKADLEAKNKSLEGKLAQVTKQSADDKTVADKSIADLKAQVAEQDTRNAAQVESIGKWKAAYDQLVTQAKAIDAKRAKLAQEKIVLDRKVEAQQRQNDELYTLGKDILHRYEHYGLGDAILNREPFTGIAKVKFENYIQTQSDKLTEQKIKD